MKNILQYKISEKTSSSSVTEYLEVIEVDDQSPEVTTPNKVFTFNASSTPSRQRKTKDGTTEIKPNDQTTMDNISEKPVGTDEALEIRVVKMDQTSTINPEPMICSRSDDQLVYGLRSNYT